MDIFLLVSGIGIYKSLEKNNISQYIINRIKRISPVWWTFLIISILLGHFVFQVHFSKLEIIGFATYTGFWLDMSNQGNWYVYAIMLFYLVSPVFYSLIKNSNRRLLTFMVLVVASLIISVPFFDNFKLIVFSRVPIYVTGMYIASSLNNISIKKSHWIGLLLFNVIGFIVLWVFYRYYSDYLWPYGLWWYPFIVIAPSLSLLLAKLFDCIKKIAKPLLSVLSIFGKSSLEILLVSDYLFANFNKLNIVIFNIRVTSIFVVIISLLIGIAFHYCIDSIIKFFNQILNRRKENG